MKFIISETSVSYAHIDAGKRQRQRGFLYWKEHKMVKSMMVRHHGLMVQEQERGITITSAATTCQWQKIINIIDTRACGFTIEVERSLTSVGWRSGCVRCRIGVEPNSKQYGHKADKYNVPRSPL